MASTPNPAPDGEPGAADDGRPPDVAMADEDDTPVARALLASLGEWWLAVPADVVHAVVRPAPVTPVGGTPRWVAGVAAVRGTVLPVVDVARLSGARAPAAADDGAWWVVVAAGGRSAALSGLRVHRVAPVGDGDEAADPPPAPPGLPARGVVRLDQEHSRGGDALPPAARLLDAAALLDLVHDPSGG